MQKKKGPSANLMYEHQLRTYGYERIVGIDEAGRGPWAGPVSAAAVCLPLAQAKLQKILTGVRDSKVMTPRQRSITVNTIKETALAWGVGSASNAEIDDFGIVFATKLAMGRAMDEMKAQFPTFQPECLFLDAMVWPEKLKELPQITMVDGDARSLTIAAASVLAKVWRDLHMLELDAQFPQYGFAEHKGYGTAKHTAALKQFGPSLVHRMSFRPVREIAKSRL
jgi:ribonuclease HII